MFGIGTTELLIIMAVALMVLGPKKLPQMARTLGKAMGEFKRVSTDLQRTINTEIEREDHEKHLKNQEEVLRGEKPEDANERQSASDKETADKAFESAKSVNELPEDETAKAEEIAKELAEEGANAEIDVEPLVTSDASSKDASSKKEEKAS